MKYVLVSAFDALLERSMPLQCIAPMTDDDIVESHRRAVLTKQIPADKAENLVIFKYGTFDDATGELDILDKPVKLVALAQFLPRKTHVKEEVSDGIQQTN